MKELKIGGTYRHFKGNLYTVVGIARHSETLEDMVIYQSQKDPTPLWVRPLSMWNEEVCANGVLVRRFTLLSEN